VVGEDVPRHAAVTVKARGPRGKEIRINAEGWFARILQHEIDHLDGVLFIDRIPKENVRPVEEDEIVQEAEVETTAPRRNGAKGGKTRREGSIPTQEHREGLAPANPTAAPADGQPAPSTPAPRTPPPRATATAHASATPASRTRSNEAHLASASGTPASRRE